MSSKALQKIEEETGITPREISRALARNTVVKDGMVTGRDKDIVEVIGANGNRIALKYGGGFSMCGPCSKPDTDNCSRPSIWGYVLAFLLGAST